jgi:AraC-like DNA-binding protein
MADVSDLSSYQYLQCNHCGFLRHRREVVTHRPQGRNDYHVIYVLDGELEVIYNKETYILHQGDFVYYPPHTEQWYRDVVGTYRFWVHFTGFVMPQILDESRLTPGVHRAEPSEYVEELFYRLVNENHSRHSISSENGLLLEILLELGKLVGAPKAASRLGGCVEYLNRHYQQPLSVTELAEMCHLSVSRFMSVFKAEQGVTPMQYLSRPRIEQACALLGATDLPVGEIAYACGYDDPLYFCRVFRKLKKMSPTAYRQTVK